MALGMPCQIVTVQQMVLDAFACRVHLATGENPQLHVCVAKCMPGSDSLGFYGHLSKSRNAILL